MKKFKDYLKIINETSNSNDESIEFPEDIKEVSIRLPITPIGKNIVERFITNNGISIKTINEIIKIMQLSIIIGNTKKFEDYKYFLSFSGKLKDNLVEKLKDYFIKQLKGTKDSKESYRKNINDKNPTFNILKNNETGCDIEITFNFSSK